MTVERAASQIQVHTANLLAMTRPWTAASNQIHYSRWTQVAGQVDELLAAFRLLLASFASLVPRQQHIALAMKPLIQGLAMRAGFACQLLDEAPAGFPAAPYIAVIRESYQCALSLRELARAFGGDSAPAATSPDVPGVSAEPVSA